jgi:hypothetical protein
MPISTDDVSVSGGSSETLTPIMVETHRVRRVEDKTNTGFDYLDGVDYDPDIGIRIFYDIEGVDVTTWSQEPSLDIHGNFDATNDPSTGEVTRIDGIGGAFKVFEFFTSVGVDITAAAGNVAPRREALEEAQGRAFTKLRFVADEGDDRVFFNDYDRVRPVAANDPAERTQEEINQELRDLFLDDYESGYQDGFRPELLDAGYSDGQEPHETGAPAPSGRKNGGGSNGTSDDSFEPDDDLPF